MFTLSDPEALHRLQIKPEELDQLVLEKKLTRTASGGFTMESVLAYENSKPHRERFFAAISGMSAPGYHTMKVQRSGVSSSIRSTVGTSHVVEMVDMGCGGTFELRHLGEVHDYVVSRGLDPRPLLDARPEPFPAGWLPAGR